MGCLKRLKLFLNQGYYSDLSQSLITYSFGQDLPTYKKLERLMHYFWGHCGRVVTLLPPTSEVGVQFSAQPQMGKLVVACCWSAVYSTEP